jgi:hypothetical protein
MKTRLLILLMIVGFSVNGQNLFTKAISKLAKGAAKANAETSANLDEIVPTVVIGSNLHSDKLGTISQSFFNGWISGGDMAFVMFTGKKGPNFVQLDGIVSIDGTPVQMLASGMYSLVTPANPSPRKIEITTSTGQKSSFTITPAQPTFKIKSINGMTDNISLDLSKDITIELSDVNVPASQLLKVSLAINQVSIKSLYDLAHVRSGSTITIPAAAFRNINIKPGGDLVYNYKKSYLQVTHEIMEDATDVTGAFPKIQYTKSYSDGKFANVTSEPQLNPGLTVKGEDKDMKYSLYKANAFLSRPFAQLKKVGLLSFTIRGTTFHESSESVTTSNTLVMGGIANTTTTTRTTTTTLQFPQQPNEVWDRFLEQLYPEFMSVVEQEFGATSVPPSSVTKSPSYQSTPAFQSYEANTKVEFSRSYKDTKMMSAFVPMSEGYGVNGVMERIMNESGTDALLTLTLDLDIAEETGGTKVLMVPMLAFEIAGKTNGLVAGTKYVKGTIESSKGVSFNANITPAELEGIIRKSDMLFVFRKALQEIKGLEKSNGDYDIVWNLQK